MDPQPDHLLTFARIARLGSVSAAADEMGLTQPAVSAQLRRLTHAVGEPLFTRHRLGVHLTQAGEGLLPHAEALVRAADGARGYVQELRGLAAGRLSIGVTGTPAAHLLPAMLGAFHARHPGIGLLLRSGNTREVLGLAGAGEVELGVVEGPVASLLPPGLVAQALLRDRLVLVVPPDHPLAGRGMRPRDLERLPLIWREPGSGTRQVVEEALGRAGLSVRRGLELVGAEAVREAVVRGIGAAFLSRLIVERDLAAGHLGEVRVRLPGLERDLALVRRPDELLSGAARRFVEEECEPLRIATLRERRAGSAERYTGHGRARAP